MIEVKKVKEIKTKNRVRKILTLSLVVALAFSLTACGETKGQSKMESTNSVEDTINQQIQNEQAPADATTEATTQATTQATAQAPTVDADMSDILSSSHDGIDIDLTTMNSDMVYSTVYQMMANTPEFEGKVVRMEGSYYASYDEGTKQTYFFVIIKDATACCQQGLEFVWGDGSHVYPDEYPSDGSEVIVTGTFESYKDNPDDVYSYVHLNNSTLEVVSEGESVQ